MLAAYTGNTYSTYSFDGKIWSATKYHMPLQAGMGLTVRGVGPPAVWNAGIHIYCADGTLRNEWRDVRVRDACMSKKGILAALYGAENYCDVHVLKDGRNEFVASVNSFSDIGVCYASEDLYYLSYGKQAATEPRIPDIRRYVLPTHGAIRELNTIMRGLHVHCVNGDTLCFANRAVRDDQLQVGRIDTRSTNVTCDITMHKIQEMDRRVLCVTDIGFIDGHTLLVSVYGHKERLIDASLIDLRNNVLFGTHLFPSNHACRIHQTII